MGVVSLRACAHLYSWRLALVVHVRMSLYQFGFRPVTAAQDSEDVADQPFVSYHLHTLDEGLVVYNQVTRAVSELVEPCTSKKKGGKGSGSYTHYTPEQRAKLVNMPLRMAMREPGGIFHLNCQT